MPDLLVYKNDIGMPKDSLGIYQESFNEKTGKSPFGTLIYNKAYISCRENKCLFKLVIGGKNLKMEGESITVVSGLFIPSKVSDTKDLYIMSFPVLKIKVIACGDSAESRNKKTCEHKELSCKNTFLAFKYENNQMLIWYDLIAQLSYLWRETQNNHTTT